MEAKSKSTSKAVILALSVLGAALSLYLTYLHYSGAETAFCVTGSGCDTVKESQYSAILGVPVALLGVIGYSLIFVLSLVSIQHRTRWLLLYLSSLAGFVFSAYLTYVEVFIVKAVCSYCVASALIITAILVMLVLEKPLLPPGISSAKLLTLSAVIAGVVLFSSVFLQSRGLSADSDNTLQVGLAKHLTKIGAAMYGSYQCPHCTTQKLLFGKEAFKYIRYVECHPLGENANPALCYGKGVTRYPTWEINGQFYLGTRSLQELARLSGYKPESVKK